MIIRNPWARHRKILSEYGLMQVGWGYDMVLTNWGERRLRASLERHHREAEEDMKILYGSLDRHREPPVE